MGPHKLQSFCKAKDTIKRTKHQPTDWERIFTNPISDRGLIYNIYKELKKLDSRKPNTPIKKWGTKWIKDLHIKPDTLKLIEKKLGKTLEDISTGESF